MTFFLLKNDGIAVKQAGLSAVLLLVLGSVLGFVCAKLLYIMLMLPFVRDLGMFFQGSQIDKLSYYGAGEEVDLVIARRNILGEYEEETVRVTMGIRPQ